MTIKTRETCREPSITRAKTRDRKNYMHGYTCMTAETTVLINGTQYVHTAGNRLCFLFFFQTLNNFPCYISNLSKTCRCEIFIHKKRNEMCYHYHDLIYN